jgi:DNA-binding phage protein
MPRKRPTTGFDVYVEQQLKRPSFRKAYAEVQSEIASTDRLVRALLRTLDEVRDKQHLSKAELARSIDAKPEMLRRLFTADAANPTLSTVVRVASALGYRIALVRGPSVPATKKTKGRSVASAIGTRRQVA